MKNIAFMWVVDTEMLSYIAPRGTNIVSFSNNYADPIIDNNSEEFTIPTVVLCNGNTASAAELFTGAIRDFGEMGIMEAYIVGETTYGKGVMQSSYPFTDGSVITLTVAYYYFPLGGCCDSIGIVPDKNVALTEEGDAQLDAALETIEHIIFNN